MLDWGIERGQMTAKKDRKSLGCVVSASLYHRVATRAQQQGTNPSAYLRKLVIEDIRTSDRYSREIGVEETALLAACLSVARQLIGNVDEETVLRLSRATVDLAGGEG